MTEALQIFAEVTSGYYLHPDEDRAASAVETMLALLAGAAQEHLARFASLLYLFGRIAQRSPAAHARFMPIIAAYGGPYPELARVVIAARTTGKFPDVAAAPLEHPTHLDVQWAEFFATGDPAVPARLAATLDREDLVRRFLRSASVVKLAALRAIGISPETDGDLDCLAFSTAERGVPIFQTLTLPEPELMALALKGAVVWSMRLNALRHPIVAEACQAEGTRAGGPGRRLLLEPAPVDSQPFAL